MSICDQHLDIRVFSSELGRGSLQLLQRPGDEDDTQTLARQLESHRLANAIRCSSYYSCVHKIRQEEYRYKGLKKVQMIILSLQTSLNVPKKTNKQILTQNKYSFDIRFDRS